LGKAKTLNTPFRLSALLALLIFMAEFLTMWLLHYFLHDKGMDVRQMYLEMFADSLVLTIMILPGLYLLIYKPMNSKIIELRNSEATLRKSEEKCRVSFDESNIGMCMVSLEGKFIKINKLLSEMFGYSQEELREKTFLDLTHPEDIEIGMELYKKMLSGELPNIRFSKRYISKTGEKVFCNVSASMVSSSDSESQFVIAQLMDITEHRMAENALRKNEAFIKTVLDNLPIGIAVNSVDPAVNFDYMNDNFPAFYRTTKEQLAESGAFWVSVYEDTDFREKIKKRVLDDCATGDPKRMLWEDVPITRKGEETTYVTAMNTPVPNNKLMISTVWDVSKRKSAEEALRVSKNSLKKAQEIGHIGSWHLDIEKNVLSWSDEEYKIFGYAPQSFEATYEAFLEAVHPDDREMVKKTYEDAINNNTPYECVHRVLRPDGEIRTVLERSEDIVDENRKTIHSIGMTLDITEIKSAEKELLRKSEHMDKFLNALPCFAVILKSNREIVAFNDIAKKIGAIEGKKCFETMTPFSSPCNWCKADNAFNDNEFKNSQFWGLDIYWDSYWIPLEEDLYLHFAFDITESKKAEEALILSKENLVLAQSVANIGSWSWDFNTNELDWSDETYDIFKFDKSKPPLFETFAATIYAEDKGRLSDAINLSKKEKILYDEKYRIIRSDNVQRHVHAKGKVQFNDKDEPVSMLGMIYDITEQVEAQEKIAASLMEKEVLLREVHHRVKNNMAVISSLLALQSGYVYEKKYLEMFNESQRRIRSMALVHEKLYESDDFAHINVKDYVESLVENISTAFLADDRNVKLNIIVDDLNLDIDNLIPCGLLMNEILTNSFKHAFNGQDNPEISVIMKKVEDGKVLLSISDNGIGLPDGFDISKPTGLGHKLIKPLAAQIAGIMEVNVNNGTEFRIIFPEKLEIARAE
jgi:PAS domain S-box-containing protein